MSLLTPSEQMMTSADYSVAEWPESGTRRDMPVIVPIPRFLAPIASKMQQLLNLDEGWNSYGARRVSRDSVESALCLLVAYSGRVPIPEVFPTARGGIKLEWGDDDEGVEMEFRPDGSIAILFDENGEMIEAMARTLNDPEVFNGLKRAEKLS